MPGVAVRRRASYLTCTSNVHSDPPERKVIWMVQPWQLALAVICGLLMLAVIFSMAFIPDNTKDFGINL